MINECIDLIFDNEKKTVNKGDLCLFTGTNIPIVNISNEKCYIIIFSIQITLNNDIEICEVSKLNNELQP